MTKSDIQKILDNFDFKTALSVYLPHCPNASLKKLLESSANSPNTFTIKKLRQGLHDLMDTLDAQPSNINLEVDNLPTEHLSHSSSHSIGEVVGDRRGFAKAYQGAPLEVQTKISERIMLVSEARLLKSKLINMDDLARRDAVLKIARNWHKAQACYEYEQYWEQYKELPPEPVKDNEIILPESVEDLIKRRNTLRTYRKRSNWSKYEAEYNMIIEKLKEYNVV